MSATAVKHVWLWHYSSSGVAWPSYGMDVGINHSAEHKMGAAASEDRVQRKHSSGVFQACKAVPSSVGVETVASRHDGGHRSHSLLRYNGHHSLMAGRQWAVPCSITCCLHMPARVCSLTAAA